MKENDMIRIFTGSEAAVIYLNEVLEEAGIPCMIRNDFQSGITAGFMGGIPSAIDVYIMKEDEDRAEPIVKEFKEGL